MWHTSEANIVMCKLRSMPDNHIATCNWSLLSVAVGCHKVRVQNGGMGKHKIESRSSRNEAIWSKHFMIIRVVLVVAERTILVESCRLCSLSELEEPRIRWSWVGNFSDSQHWDQLLPTWCKQAQSQDYPMHQAEDRYRWILWSAVEAKCNPIIQAFFFILSWLEH